MIDENPASSNSPSLNELKNNATNKQNVIIEDPSINASQIENKVISKIILSPFLFYSLFNFI